MFPSHRYRQSHRRRQKAQIIVGGIYNQARSLVALYELEFIAAFIERQADWYICKLIEAFRALEHELKHCGFGLSDDAAWCARCCEIILEDRGEMPRTGCRALVPLKTDRNTDEARV